LTPEQARWVLELSKHHRDKHIFEEYFRSQLADHQFSILTATDGMWYTYRLRHETNQKPNTTNRLALVIQRTVCYVGTQIFYIIWLEFMFRNVSTINPQNGITMSWQPVSSLTHACLQARNFLATLCKGNKSGF
jgi:hypothetical protein